MTGIWFWFFFDVLGPLTYHLNSAMTCFDIIQNDDSLDNMYLELRTANRKLIHQLSRQYPEICWSPGRSVSRWSHHCRHGPVGWAVGRSPCWGRCRGCWGGPRQLCWSCCTCHMCHLHSSNGGRESGLILCRLEHAAGYFSSSRAARAIELFEFWVKLVWRKRFKRVSIDQKWSSTM